MPSSTLRRGSLNTRLLGVLLSGVIGTPLIWLTTAQTGYVLAYQACDDRSRSWVLVPTLAAVAITAIAGAIVMRGHRQATGERIPLPFVARLAIGMAALMVIVLVASAVAPAILNPCD
jgi:hypothetical protein